MHHDVRTDDSREMNQNVRYTTFCSLRVEHCISVYVSYVDNVSVYKSPL